MSKATATQNGQPLKIDGALTKDDVIKLVSEAIKVETNKLLARQHLARQGDFDVEVRSISEQMAALSRVETAICIALVRSQA